MKTCSKCGETKPLSGFGKDVCKRDGIRSKCKSCCNIASAAWYANNAEKHNANSAKRYAANPAIKKARSSKAYADNRKKVIAASTRWASENRNKVKENQANWKAANRDVVRIHSQNRRARKVGKLSNWLADRLFKLQRGKCACGCKQPLGHNFHLDHRMPLALGGTNTDDNMQLLTAMCNQQKHAKHPVDFMQQRGFLL